MNNNKHSVLDRSCAFVISIFVLLVPVAAAFAKDKCDNQCLDDKITALQGVVAAQNALIAQLQGDVAGMQAQVTANLTKINSAEATLGCMSKTGNDVFFTGCNVRVVNGTGRTESVNGLGNLIVGYDESGADPEGGILPAVKTGSHNIVSGFGNTYSAYGGLVMGLSNRITGNYAVVLNGRDNRASGVFSSVTGGKFNSATGGFSSVSGGQGNTAGSQDSSVSGGLSNVATGGQGASVSGGFSNTASGQGASVSGGFSNTASGFSASIGGGENNTASGRSSSVSGGYSNTANGQGASVSGGYANITDGNYASVSGGQTRVAPGDFSWAAGSLFEPQ